jgi:isoquinoline 1-oxidoreductase beta subunit
VAVVARPPVFGAKVAKFDASKAKAIKGVIDVLEVKTDRGGSGVVVIADWLLACQDGPRRWRSNGTPAPWTRSAATSSWPSSRRWQKPGTARGRYLKLAGAAKKIDAVYEFPWRTRRWSR